jgi:hypothetical protein
MASLDDVNVSIPVQENRGYAVDAAIVRIMKARRKLAHASLQNEVINQLRYFIPQPKVRLYVLLYGYFTDHCDQLIKQRIEQLIERDYLRRSDEDSRVYEYLP